ncbi:MAG: ATP synthase F1 subunit delta [Rickettsiales bacterium]|nr:ATP synthase F1 subunit delta [Rickettsiales bacterium]
MKISGSKRIAERYVKALFDVAAQAKAIEAVEKDLDSLGHIIGTSAEFRHFLTNPLITPHMRGQAMLAILDKLSASQLTRQFIGMVLQQKRMGALPEIINEFARAAAASRGELAAEIVSASPMSATEVKQVETRLSKAYGRTLRLEVKQDPSLLGGVILRIGSQQLDSSLAGKMRRLQQSLKAA